MQQRGLGIMTRLSKPDVEDVRKGAWTAEEDEKLRLYVEINGTGHWRSVGKKAGTNFEIRNAISFQPPIWSHSHSKFCCSCRFLLVHTTERKFVKDFRRIENYVRFPTGMIGKLMIWLCTAAAGLQRCGKSCRLRWTNYLRPDIRHGSFSSAEEDLIVKLHASHGSR